MDAAPTVTLDRLRSGRDIAAVLKGRRHRAGRLAVVYVTERATDSSAPRLAVVASRKVGSAVARNRAKRLLREAAVRVDWQPGLDIVLVARAACADSRAPEVHRELVSLAAELGCVRREAA